MFDNHHFKLDQSDIEQFQRNGFVKLKNFLNDDAISFLRKRADAEMANSHFGDLVNRIKYELQDQKQTMYELVSSDSFRDPLVTITGKELFFAFDMALEIEKNKSRGFPWHVGIQTFAIQMLEDFGCTIWVPLEKICTNDQAGGVACVSKRVVSGEFIYEKIEPAIVSTLKNKEKQGIKTSLENYYFLKHEILNSPAMLEILENHKIEEDYDLGDVLLFDKNVIHRSVMLKDGILEKRAAFVLRFMDTNARFNKKQAINVDYPAQKYGANLFSQAHNQINLAHGELFLNSNYFDNLNKRILKRVMNVSG